MPTPNTAAVTVCRPLSVPELCLCTDIFFAFGFTTPERLQTPAQSRFRCSRLQSSRCEPQSQPKHSSRLLFARCERTLKPWSRSSKRRQSGYRAPLLCLDAQLGTPHECSRHV